MLQGLRSEQEQNYFVGTRRFSSSNQFWTMTMRGAEPTEFQRRRPDATRGTVDQQGSPATTRAVRFSIWKAVV